MPRLKDLLEVDIIKNDKDLTHKLVYNFVCYQFPTHNNKYICFKKLSISSTIKYNFNSYYSIIDSFKWSKTSEGEYYWRDIASKLNK